VRGRQGERKEGGRARQIVVCVGSALRVTLEAWSHVVVVGCVGRAFIHRGGEGREGGRTRRERDRRPRSNLKHPPHRPQELRVAVRDCTFLCAENARLR